MTESGKLFECKTPLDLTQFHLNLEQSEEAVGLIALIEKEAGSMSTWVNDCVLNHVENPYDALIALQTNEGGVKQAAQSIQARIDACTWLNADNRAAFLTVVVNFNYAMYKAIYEILLETSRAPASPS